MKKKILSRNNFLLTYLNYNTKTQKLDENNILNIPLTFPTIRNKTLDKKEFFNINPKKEKIFMRNMKTFISPLNKINLEKKKLDKIKQNLVLKRFKELHNYKLKINPNNYYHNYGLNTNIIITNKFKDKENNNDYKYNNISSYNNIFKVKEEKKKIKVKIKKKEKEKEFLLKCLPYRLKNVKYNSGVIQAFNKETLTEENSIWRTKNINEMIHNSIDFDFLNNFMKNSKSMGKLKLKK